MSATGNAWTELVPPVYPEGDYVAVHCHKCGDKNRQDDGWRYRNDPVQRAAEEAELRRMGLSRGQLIMMLWSMGNGTRLPVMAVLTYQCEQCRDDRKQVDDDAVVPRQPDEHPIASRTRSRTRKV